MLFSRVLLLVFFAVITSSNGFAGTYTEDFTTTAFKDTANTTADWDTTGGELRLFPFLLSLAGTYNTTGTASEVAIAGDLIFVADGAAGLLVIDILDPTNPDSVGLYDSPGFANGVAVAGDLAFVADGTAGLQVIDISDPTNPTLTGSYNTPGNAFGVAVAGDLAFVADFTSGLLVIDISDPTNPDSVGTYNTTGTAFDIVVVGDLAFVADGATGLQVIDILDPTTPTLAGSYNTTGNANGVAAAGDLAFIADQGSGLQVIDISDPAIPTLAGSYNTPGNAFGVAVAGDVAFVADFNEGLQIIDISDPTNPTLADSYNTPGNANSVSVAGDRAFVADQGSGLQVIDISDPITLTLAGSYITPGTARDVVVAGDLAFVADYTSGLQVIDISDPINPALTGSYNTPGLARAVAVDGDLAFVADDSGLLVIDISDPTNPDSVGTYDTPDQTLDVALAGDLAFVADRLTGLLVIDISDPANPDSVGAYDNGVAQGVAVAGDLVFVAGGGLHVIDISDPANPTLAGTYLTPAGGKDVAVAGDLAFVADGTPGLQVIDISDPANPTLTGSYDTSDAFSVAVAGDRAFVADSFAGLHVIDISDPANPTLTDTYDTPNIAQAVTVAGDRAFVADGAFGLQVVQAFQREVITSNNVGRSLVLDGATDTIVRARLSSTQSLDVSWELSADGGSNFQPFTPGAAWTAFVDPGTDLLWRSTHTWAVTGGNPAASSVNVEWLNDFAPIATIADVPGDQGGWVRLNFVRSGYDFPDETSLPVSGYQIYRRIDSAALALEIETNGAPMPLEAIQDAPLASLDPSTLRHWEGRYFVSGTKQPATAGTFPSGTWEVVSVVLPTQSESYTTVMPTLADSSQSGPFWSVYFVTTHTPTPSVWFASAPDSGYSLDNIAPGVPQGMAAAYGQGSVALTWDAAPEEDFQYFRVYRSTDPGFVPGAGTLVHETASNSWQDSPADPSSVFYKITALDYAGNESGPASSGSVTAVGDNPVTPRAFVLRAATPNPSRSGTRIAFDLPLDSTVSLEVFDVAGRLVRNLAHGSMLAGAHEISWDGADDSGQKVAAGVYLYRLRAGSFESTRRVVVTR